MSDRDELSERRERWESYADLDDAAPGVRASKAQGKERRQGSLTNLNVYGRNRKAGAQRRVDAFEHKRGGR